MSRRRGREEDPLAIEAPLTKRAHFTPNEPTLPMELVMDILERSAMDHFKTICPQWDALAAVIVKHEALLSGAILLGAWLGSDEAWSRAPSRILKIYSRLSDTTALAKDVGDTFQGFCVKQDYGHRLHARQDLVIKIVAAPPNVARSLWELREWHSTRAHMLTPLGWLSWSALAASPDRLQLYSPRHSTCLMLDRLWAKVLWFNPRCEQLLYPHRWMEGYEKPDPHPLIHATITEIGAHSPRGIIANGYLSKGNRAFKWCMRGYAIWKLGLLSLELPRFPNDMCATWTPPTTRLIEFDDIEHMLDFAARLVPLKLARDVIDQRDRMKVLKRSVTFALPTCRYVPSPFAIADGCASVMFEHGHMAHGTILVHRENSRQQQPDRLETNVRVLDLDRRNRALNPTHEGYAILADAIPWSISSAEFLSTMEQFGSEWRSNKVMGLHWTFHFRRDLSMLAQLVLEFVCWRFESALPATLMDIIKEFPTVQMDVFAHELESYVVMRRDALRGVLTSAVIPNCAAARGPGWPTLVHIND